MRTSKRVKTVTSSVSWKRTERIGVIINPASGKGKWKRAERLIYETFNPNYKNLRVLKGKTVYDNSCQLLGWADKIILIGGDGSLNSLAQAIFDTHKNPIILFVPTGTANDMAYNLGLPKEITNILSLLFDGFGEFEVIGKNVDLGVVKTGERTRVFLNNFGLVASVELLKKFKKLKERYPSLLAYLFTIFSIFLNGFSDPKISVEMEFEKSFHQQTRKRTSVCFLGNGARCGRFFKATPEADLSDGFLDFCFMSKMFRISMFEYLFDYMFGIHLFKKRVLTFDDHLPQVKGLKIELEKAKEYQIDGDIMDPEKNFHIQILENRLKFLAPKENLE